MYILVCTVDDKQYAFNLEQVLCTYQAVEITPMIQGGTNIAGVINVHGEVVPVINMRQLLGLPNRPLDPKDRFVLCKHKGKNIALWVDTVCQVRTCDEKQVTTVENGKRIEAVLKDSDKLIHFFNLAEIT